MNSKTDENSKLPPRPEIPYPELPDIWEAINQSPVIDPTAWIAPNSTVIGKVTLGKHASVHFGCVLRGDGEGIFVGDESNIQDLSVLHTDRGYPCILGNRVTVGHRAIVHGAKVADDVMIGMGAIVLTGCEIGRGALIAAGAVLREGTIVPPETLWAGIPAKEVRQLTADQQGRMALAYRHYVNSGVLYSALESQEG